jgi:hypothetical protein
MPLGDNRVADMPGGFRAEKLIAHNRHFLAEQPVKPGLLGFVVHHDQMEGYRRVFRIAELIGFGELARVINGDLVDVDPCAVGMLVAEESQAAADRIARIERFLRQRRRRQQKSKQREYQATHQNNVRCFIAADSVPSSR